MIAMLPAAWEQCALEVEISEEGTTWDRWRFESVYCNGIMG
jgi:hypothetical protein